MKLLVVFFFSLLGIGKSCQQQQKPTETEVFSLEYTATSRGFYQKITVKNHSLTVNSDRNGTEKPKISSISDSDWKYLSEEIKKIDTITFKTLKAPTEKRFYDGAAIANLSISIAQKELTSPAFDHGNPPKEIEKIITKLFEVAKQ